MSVLITGSLAYDTIMVFPDSFKNHIIPEKVHILNVCFLVPELRKEFGGCAGNIAYNLNMLGESALPMATVGEDFKPYRKWLKKSGMNQDCIVEIDNTFTAQAYLTTDMDDNQIIAFHPGAMNHAHQNVITPALDISLAIIAPDGKQAMIEHAEQLYTLGTPFFFDPGQGLPMFNADELKRFIEIADFVVVNDYESEMLARNSALSIDEIAAQVDALIITRGAKGAEIYAHDKKIDIPAAPISTAVDPTGCGDAFRAGLLYGVKHQLDWETSGRMAALLGAIKIEKHGTQNHSFTLAEFKTRYADSFGSELTLAA
jgi:adenosine kinase